MLRRKQLLFYGTLLYMFDLATEAQPRLLLEKPCGQKPAKKSKNEYPCSGECGQVAPRPTLSLLHRQVSDGVNGVH